MNKPSFNYKRGKHAAHPIRESFFSPVTGLSKQEYSEESEIRKSIYWRSPPEGVVDCRGLEYKGYSVGGFKDIRVEESQGKKRTLVFWWAEQWGKIIVLKY